MKHLTRLEKIIIAKKVKIKSEFTWTVSIYLAAGLWLVSSER